MTDGSAFILICLLIWSAVQTIRFEKKLNEILDAIKSLQAEKPSATQVKFYNQGKEVINMDLEQGNDLALDVKFFDAKNVEAAVEGIQWLLGDMAAGALEVAADGKTALFKPAGQPVEFDIQVKADAKLGEGEEFIVGTFGVKVLAGKAILVKINGVAVPQVVAEPVVENPIIQGPVEPQA